MAVGALGKRVHIAAQGLKEFCILLGYKEWNFLVHPGHPGQENRTGEWCMKCTICIKSIFC